MGFLVCYSPRLVYHCVSVEAEFSFDVDSLAAFCDEYIVFLGGSYKCVA